MSPEEYESLRSYAGQDLIVTDGTTLLGADDKAGVGPRFLPPWST
jgi:tripeptide aminopeptidase